MSPAPTQRGEIALALSALFALKGQTPLLLDETVVPTAVVAQMMDTPYLRYAEPVMRQIGVAAVALNFAYSMVRPGPLKILQIRQIIINNSDVAAHQFGIGIGTAAFYAQLDTPGTLSALVDVASPIAGTVVSSIGQNAQDVAGTDTGARRLTTVNIPAASAMVITFPDPGICLFGDDEGGIPVLFVRVTDLVNIGFNASFMGRQWPLIGR